MNQLSGGKNSGVLLILALVMALLFAVYYYVVLPKTNDVSAMESSVSTLQSEVSTLQESIALVTDEQNQTSVNPFALRKKVPQDRDMMDLLLNIEEVGFVADSRIVSINFNNYDTPVAESALQDPNQVEAVEGEQSAEQSPDEATVQAEGEASDVLEQAPPVSSIARETLPTALKMVTFSIDVESPNAAQLEVFIKELETLERIMRVDTIQYSLPGEENEFAEDRSDIVNATIQVTTFYYEGNK